MRPFQLLLLLVAWMGVFSVVLAQQQTACKPQPAKATCVATPECEGILRKAYSLGCKKKDGRKLLDGGCQCQGYCGYQCASACGADPECKWDPNARKCLNRATNIPGTAISVCRSTRSPTSTPTKAPTLSPSHSPSAAPSLPTKRPTNAPTSSPTRSRCHRLPGFPGAPLPSESTRYDGTVGLGISANGRTVVFSRTYYEYEVGQTDEVWVTTQNRVTGKWKPQLLVEQVSMTDVYNQAYTVSFDATVSGDGEFVLLVTTIMESNSTYTFLKRQADGQFKAQASLTSPKTDFDAWTYVNTVWLSANGDRAMVAYTLIPVIGGLPNVQYAANFLRVAGTWKVEWIQNDLPIVAMSADGNTAFVVPIDSMKGYLTRLIYVRRNSLWVQQSGDLVGTGLPTPRYYQGSPHSTLTADGNTLVMGAYVFDDDDYQLDHNPEESGAWVFVRNNGNWTQRGPKLGGGNAHDGAYTGISGDGKTIMLSAGVSPLGFRMYSKTATSYEQSGPKVTTTFKAPIMSNNGARVLTSKPVSIWGC